jgi:hypothetical protein
LIFRADPGSGTGKDVQAAGRRLDLIKERRDPPGTSTPRSPGGSADGAAGANPARVRTNRVERPTALPLPVGAPLSDFWAIAERYPVYRIDPE